MNEVVSSLDAYQGVGGCTLVAHVNSNGPRLRREGGKGPAKGDHIVPAIEQLGREATSDEARSPGDGNNHREPFPRVGFSIAAQPPSHVSRTGRHRGPAQ